ncbi:MAG TPA: hypothetical protein VF746_20865 [Longimicrobium sp.]|jgi:ElaB/YqjD/DUF883 family membrane-anchored ribosome-binding protein
MAEIRISHEGDPDATLPAGAAPAGVNRTPETDPDHLLPERAGRGTPGTVAASSDPDVVRDEIERTRARMSETIDTIEEVLLRKKERLEERLDVAAPVRERVREQPWLYVGGTFAAGLALGLLTGGGDDEDHRRAVPTMEIGLDTDDGTEHSEDRGWKRRAKKWEKRARKLQKASLRHEEEIRTLRGGAEEEEEGGGLFGAVSAGLSGAVAGVVSRLTGGGGMDVEVDLEQPRGTTDTLYGGQAQGTAGASYAAQPQGDLQVEVDLEPAHGTPHPYYSGPPREHHYHHAGEMQVEVDLEEEGRGRKPVLMGLVGTALTAVVATAVARLVTGRRREARELDVEVELERQASYAAQPTYTAAPSPPPYASPVGAAGTEVEVDLESRPGSTYPFTEGEMGSAPRAGEELRVEVDLERRPPAT